MNCANNVSFSVFCLHVLVLCIFYTMYITIFIINKTTTKFNLQANTHLKLFLSLDTEFILNEIIFILLNYTENKYVQKNLVFSISSSYIFLMQNLCGLNLSIYLYIFLTYMPISGARPIPSRRIFLYKWYTALLHCKF